jgi:hypothetical protein
MRETNLGTQNISISKKIEPAEELGDDLNETAITSGPRSMKCGRICLKKEASKPALGMRPPQVLKPSLDIPTKPERMTAPFCTICEKRNSEGLRYCKAFPMGIPEIFYPWGCVLRLWFKPESGTEEIARRWADLISARIEPHGELSRNKKANVPMDK